MSGGRSSWQTQRRPKADAKGHILCSFVRDFYSSCSRGFCMTKFRIKSEQEMQKPFGKCIRLLEDLQFYRQRVVPTDDPKWFRRVHPDHYVGSPRLRLPATYLVPRSTTWCWESTVTHKRSLRRTVEILTLETNKSTSQPHWSKPNPETSSCRK